MPLILCTLKNASTNINGVEFKQTEKGLISASVDQDVADYFASIPGYEVIKAQGKAADKAADKPAEDDAGKA